MLNLDCALAVGHSVRYAGEPNGESYMELVVRCRATSTADTHILKANHPDDARNWVRDLQARLRTTQMFLHSPKESNQNRWLRVVWTRPVEVACE